MRLYCLAAITILASSALRAQVPINLDLRCPSPCSFQQGESIWLNLDFASVQANGYQILTNHTDRDFAFEDFSVTPSEGVSDPTAPYMALIRVQGGSFGFTLEPPSDASISVPINLNQWVRFDRPGTYHVSVASRRETPVPGATVRTAVVARSNDVTITIVPADPQWQKDQMTRILRVLDVIPNSMYTGQPNEIRELGNLGTLDAALQIARRMDGGGNSSAFRLYEFGMIRSPFRAEGVREMERLLIDPDFPVTELFLSGLANVSIDPVSDRAELVGHQQAKLAEVRQKLIDALPLKRGSAQTVSTKTRQQFH